MTPQKTPYRFSQIGKLATFYPLEPSISVAEEPPVKLQKVWTTGAARDEAKKVFHSLPDLLTQNAVLGIEVEVEKCPPLTVVPTWSVASDNSLRDNGIEFLLYPSTPNAAKYSLIALLDQLKHCRPTPNFSWRTSLHVHLNMRDERLDQLLGLVVLYLLFEDSIFEFVGEERRRSNFCVPLQDTGVSEGIAQMILGEIRLPTLLNNWWQKYAALNLRPLLINDHAGPAQGLQGKGTIEFRHLEGTRNLPRILSWINIILALQIASRKYSLEYLEERITEMGTRSDYLDLMTDVFGHLLPTPRDFSRILYSSVAYAKECFCPVPSVAKILAANQKTKKPTGLQQLLKVRCRPSVLTAMKKKVSIPKPFETQLSEIALNFTTQSASAQPAQVAVDWEQMWAVPVDPVDDSDLDPPS